MSGGDILAGWTEALQAGELRFPRCSDCEAWNWYPLPQCRVCGSRAMKWMPVDPVGELYSWTRVHRAFGGEPAADLPYVTGVVSIAAAPGVRLVCLQQASARDPVIGTTVKLAPEHSTRGNRWTFKEVSEH